jgi:uncharacterized membrane protein YraQ (UPF0718 family)
MNTFAQTLRFFVIIMTELTVLFVGISFLVELVRARFSARMQTLLTSRGGRGNIIGAALGAITPFCSCSTIPIMMGMLDAGVPFGSAVSFLLASPLLNPIIMGLFVAFFGLKVAAMYGILIFAMAVLLGILWEKLGLANDVKRVRVAVDHQDPTQAGEHRSTARQALTQAWSQFCAVFPYLIVGTAIGAAIYGMAPSEWISGIAGPSNPFAVPVAAIIGIPLYIRVETMVPIGKVLLEKGMSMGAVAALIIGGAGASIPEVSLLAAIFKPRLVAAFVATVLVLAMLTGYAFNLALAIG